MSQRENNEMAVRQCFESASRGDFDTVATVLEPDYVLHPDEARGLEGLRPIVEGYREALADLRISIDQQFTEGDHVATRFTVHGRHEGELLGIRPTGREVAVSGITISRCTGGRIAEEWELIDVPGLLRQLGAQPGADAG